MHAVVAGVWRVGVPGQLWLRQEPQWAVNQTDSWHVTYAAHRKSTRQGQLRAQFKRLKFAGNSDVFCCGKGMSVGAGAWATWVRLVALFTDACMMFHTL